MQCLIGMRFVSGPTLFVVTLFLSKLTAAGNTINCPCGCRCKKTRIDCSRTFCANFSHPFAPETTHLKLRQLGLTTLEESAFTGLYHLVYLDLGSNNLTCIPSGLFSSTPRLHAIVLRSNQLNVIPSAVRHCRHLRKLDLSDNDICRLSVADVATIAAVETVNLRQNRIDHIASASGVVANCAIKDLDLSGNAMTVLRSNSFNAFSSLNTLNISTNNISLIDRSAFVGLSSLQNLDLAGNNLPYIDSLTFRPLSSLLSLNLSSSSIESFGDGAFCDVANLKELNLSHNEIDKIGGWLFGLESLATIDLSHNSVGRLDEGQASMWTLVPTLEWLSLAHNRISYVPKTFSQHNLKYLSLEGNLIHDIDRDAFEELVQLNTMDLSDNFLDVFFEDGEGFKFSIPSLEELRLASNGITTLPASFFVNFSKLKILDLRQNPISVMRDNTFESLKLQKLMITTSSLICDCNLNWLLDWFNASNLNPDLVDMQCIYPPRYNGSEVFDVPLANLTCDFSPQPRIQNHSKLLVRELMGDSSKLVCNISAATPLDIEWTFYQDSQRTIVSETKAVDNLITYINDSDGNPVIANVYSELLLENITATDEGEYRCSAKNLYGAVHSPKMKFTVNQEPRLTVLPSDVNAEAGSTAKFKCSAYGRPAPTIKWSKDGDVFPAAEERRLYVPSNEDCIFITGVKKSDAGVYKCTAENWAGFAEASAALSVYEVHASTKWKNR